MKNHAMKSNESGVSESIGFMLIFSIVIAGIAIVTLYGYPLLLQQQLGAEEKIMEKNMIVLQNDMKSLAYKTVPYKETALKIGSGSLTVYNSSYSPSSSTIDISYPGCSPTTKCVDSFKPGELRYESVSAQTDISLQNGAVLMRPRNQKGSTMLAEPRWYYDVPTKTLVINLINVTSDNLMAKEGIGTVRMKLGETNYASIIPTSNGQVTLDYTPDPGLNGLDYSVGWDNFMKKTFSNQFSTPPSGTPGTGNKITYTISPVDTLVIKKYEVKIEAI
jgi:hypothetical protein